MAPNYIELRPEWPESWKLSHHFDREELWGEVRNPGYVYAYQNRRNYTLKLLGEVLEPGASVIDVAAGQGNFSLALAGLGYRVTWNDLRHELEGYVRLKDAAGVLRYAPGNAFELGFPAPFDAVLITEIIEHVAHPDDFLRKTAQLVKPGGYIIMTTPNGKFFNNPLPRFSDCPDSSVFESEQFKPDGDGHIFLLHPDEIRRLADDAGLALDLLVHFTNPLTNGYLKTTPLLRVLPDSVVWGIESTMQWLPRALGERLLIHSAARFRRIA